jgi:hypothetical protein
MKQHEHGQDCRAGPGRTEMAYSSRARGMSHRRTGCKYNDRDQSIFFSLREGFGRPKTEFCQLVVPDGRAVVGICRPETRGKPHKFRRDHDANGGRRSRSVTASRDGLRLTEGVNERGLLLLLNFDLKKFKGRGYAGAFISGSPCAKNATDVPAFCSVHNNFGKRVPCCGEATGHGDVSQPANWYCRYPTVWSSFIG